MSRLDAKQKAPRLTRPLVPRASWGLRTPTALRLELLVDLLAVGADRRAGFGGLRHREHLAAQRDDVRAHHRALGDLVLLDVVEEFRGVAVGPVVNAFVGVGAFDRLGSHAIHFARKKTDTYSGRRLWNSGDMKQSPELSFDDDGRPVLITRAAPSYEVQHRERVRKYLTLMFWRIPALILAAVAYGIWENGLISLTILAASVPLPWIAVLIANDRPPRRAEEPRRYESARRIPLFPTAERPALEYRAYSSRQSEEGEPPGDVPG